MGAWKYLRVILLPVMGTAVIPGVILWLTGPDTLGLWQSAPVACVALPVLGGALICLGLVLTVATIRLFVTVGKGTPAPWNPPQRLVVRGVYCHVRNPMISGVLFVVLGEAVLAASLPLLGLFALAVIVNAVYIPLSEEPGLANRFGEEYEVYRRNVPRWIPRLRPWQTEPPGHDTMFFEVGVPVVQGATTAAPPTKEEIERLLAVAPRYGIEIRLPPH